MNKVQRCFLVALIALGFSGVFSAPAAASILKVETQSFNVLDGGQFTATLDGLGILMYCVDDKNYLAVPGEYEVNVSTMADLSKTRYGTTPTGSFFYGSGLSAYDRYISAAWLIGSYDLAVAANDQALDRGIQSSIWKMMTTDSQFGDNGGDLSWFNKAVQWVTTASISERSAVAAKIRIIDSVSVASAALPQKYGVGMQEQITFIPEPGTWLTLSIGLVLVLLASSFRRQSVGK